MTGTGIAQGLPHDDIALEGAAALGAEAASEPVAAGAPASMGSRWASDIMGTRIRGKDIRPLNASWRRPIPPRNDLPEKRDRCAKGVWLA
ncbi:hypothetical protein HL653_07040 [Sphingomonas sp. AP4-R1]|uniref:hypothetical protein n=1 Tax=Sphingomonas sp. AP4-R1 TaxID=2735134 RepID=UPI001493D0EF|nr:hypothetical protein [Sphingomonas sp. AP4-R1]QJU57576.1 hypothetical protein HL653_07040 [Sphingomonas sp. AP4-R1]